MLIMISTTVNMKHSALLFFRMAYEYCFCQFSMNNIVFIDSTWRILQLCQFDGIFHCSQVAYDNDDDDDDDDDDDKEEEEEEGAYCVELPINYYHGTIAVMDGPSKLGGAA